MYNLFRGRVEGKPAIKMVEPKAKSHILPILKTIG